MKMLAFNLTANNNNLKNSSKCKVQTPCVPVSLEQLLPHHLPLITTLRPQCSSKKIKSKVVRSSPGKITNQTLKFQEMVAGLACCSPLHSSHLDFEDQHSHFQKPLIFRTWTVYIPSFTTL